MRRGKTHTLALCAALTAAALVVFVIESQMPPLTAIPGIKPGLSNVFTLFALCRCGGVWALGLTLARVTLGCLLTGQTMAFFYSLAGGLLALAVMRLALRRMPAQQLWVVSVFGAMAHNLAQLAVAVGITRTAALAYYLPVLLLAGIVTGAFTGLCAQLVLRRLPEGARK